MGIPQASCFWKLRKVAFAGNSCTRFASKRDLAKSTRTNSNHYGMLAPLLLRRRRAWQVKESQTMLLPIIEANATAERKYEQKQINTVPSASFRGNNTFRGCTYTCLLERGQQNKPNWLCLIYSVNCREIMYISIHYTIHIKTNGNLKLVAPQSPA